MRMTTQVRPDTRTGYIHLTIISNQCCALLILMKEIFPKEKVTKYNSHRFEHGINLGVLGWSKQDWFISL